MIRTVLLASVLALAAGCLDEQPTTGTSDQDLLIKLPLPTYTSLAPEWWTARAINNSDYWDFGTSATIAAAPPNLQMTAFIVNGEAATYTAAGAGTEATRMVWLISNSRVFKVYEVYVSDVGQMSQMMHSAFTNVENGYAAQGYQAPGSSIIVGVDGGVTGGGKKGGGPPHGFPTAVVQAMVNNAAAVRSVIVAIPNIGAGSLAP
ncbi:MAG: hypothetical protein ABI591_03360 [Kofleriaceae bacterium]